MRVIVNEVCCMLTKRKLPHYVKFPSGGVLDTVVRGFDTRWEFPQCIGAINGTHIPIVVPHISMQATVDTYCFTIIFIGWPMRVHDARLFANSELFEKGEYGTLFASRPRHICGVEIHLVILGDCISTVDMAYEGIFRQRSLD